MQNFNDRRPMAVVPRIDLKSRAALEQHMATHHGYGGAYESHAEVREAHAESHADQFAVVYQPHQHDRMNPNPMYDASTTLTR